MPRSAKTKDKTVFYGVRVSAELAERVEAMRDQLQEQSPYTKVSTADVLRLWIEEGSQSGASVFSTSLSQPKGGPKRTKSRSGKREAKNA